MKVLEELFQEFYSKLNGFNFTDYSTNDEVYKIFDFDFKDCIFTLKLTNNNIQLANNVDVYDKEGYFYDNVSINQLK